MEKSPISMQDKFALNREQVLFLAKKKLDESVLCAMKLQGKDAALLQVKSILEGGEAEDIDTEAVKKLASAWDFIFNNLDEPISVDYIYKLGEFFSLGEISISDKEDAERELKGILNGNRSNTRKGINIFLWALKHKPFWEKSAAIGFLAANKYLVASGAGVLLIKLKDYEAFDELLRGFYAFSKSSDLGKFLYENAIEGMKVVVHRRG